MVIVCSKFVFKNQKLSSNFVHSLHGADVACSGCSTLYRQVRIYVDKKTDFSERVLPLKGLKQFKEHAVFATYDILHRKSRKTFKFSPMFYT